MVAASPGAIKRKACQPKKEQEDLPASFSKYPSLENYAVTKY